MGITWIKKVHMLEYQFTDKKVSPYGWIRLVEELYIKSVIQLPRLWTGRKFLGCGNIGSKTVIACWDTEKRWAIAGDIWLE